MMEARRHQVELLLLLSVLVCSAACDSEPRVPYIPPKLERWADPYRGMPGLRLRVFTTGHWSVPEALLLRGGGVMRTRDLPVPAFVIEHPRHGLILFGTGMSQTAVSSTALPSDLFELGSQRSAAPGSDVKSQMQQAGLKPETVRWLVLSSLRADQIGALDSFPAATVVVARTEVDAVGHGDASNSAAHREMQNWKIIDFDAAEPFATFPASVDLFGDGSLMLIDARGATPGTIALFVRLPHRPILLTGDAAAVAEQVRHAIPSVSAADRREWWDRLWRVKRFQDLVPSLIVVPGYDLSPIESATIPDVIVQVPPKAAASPRPVPTPALLERLLPHPM
jgi:N-acyl homoserine lactone hydrolase